MSKPKLENPQGISAFLTFFFGIDFDKIDKKELIIYLSLCSTHGVRRNASLRTKALSLFCFFFYC